MIVKDKISKVPKWSKSNINRWADYVELMCLYDNDHLISKDDVLDIFFEGDIEELNGVKLTIPINLIKLFLLLEIIMR